MSFCLTELYLWSLKNSLHVGDGDVGVHHYHEKKESAPFPEYGFLEERQQLAESRSFSWVLKNKRPEKLRDNLVELEELMQSSECVLSKWKNKYVCQLLFSSGVLVSISLSGPQLEKLVIDRTLVGKLISNPISDAVFTDTFIILSFLKENKLCLIQFTKKTGSPDINRQMEKLSSLDMKISYIDIPGPKGRHLNRHLTINSVQDLAVCWWPVPEDDVWPWTPVTSEKDRANMVLLGCSSTRLEVLSYIRTEGDILEACFSGIQPYQVYTTEKSMSSNSEPMADSCIYECARNKLQCVSVTKIPLSARVISCGRNPDEDKLVLGCEDSSLILYEAHRRVTLLVQAELLPVLIRWHPSGCIFVVSNNQGELQIFNMALSPIMVQLVAEDSAPRSTLQCCKHFEVSSSLVDMKWAAPRTTSDNVDIHNLLFLRFHGGPLGVLQLKLGAVSRGLLGPVELVSQYLRYDEVDDAIGMLSSMNWNTAAQQCYICMSAIMNHLLKQKLTPEKEAQLEACLGTFYSLGRPLMDAIILEYRDPISRYARRFFHHLLRHQRFEKAFLLAVDIGARDLFMDIHYLALDKGELALAKVAEKKAKEIDAESINAGVESLLPMDRMEDLNEAFVDLSLIPQGGERDDIANSTQRNSGNRQLVHIENEIGIEVYAESLDKALPWNLGCKDNYSRWHLCWKIA
ncbi:WD repeat-containing and planar cell polarity effector protein fritz homolog isoform X2 [Hyperolius riggenbachi]|uniref:WD repeat-containing and planar cell polarity effector protein fritz homolog isoform X2 n=1 Tax=Hyperolius riggenbachi TaxID=752182 RepID=UPI0035A31D55